MSKEGYINKASGTITKTVTDSKGGKVNLDLKKVPEGMQAFIENLAEPSETKGSKASKSGRSQSVDKKTWCSFWGWRILVGLALLIAIFYNSIFPNEDSLLRLVSAVLIEISETWETGNTYISLNK